MQLMHKTVKQAGVGLRDALKRTSEAIVAIMKNITADRKLLRQ